jgi:hypothetical protein
VDSLIRRSVINMRVPTYAVSVNLYNIAFHRGVNSKDSRVKTAIRMGDGVVGCSMACRNLTFFVGV